MDKALEPIGGVDIVVVGGGLAGATAAAVLGRRWRVVLVDPRPTCPPVFKAEKIEPDQAEILRKLGLLHNLIPHVRRIREIRSYYRGRLVRVVPTEQYGARYSVLVNAIRTALPKRVEFRLGRVANVSTSAEVQRVKLDTGESLMCRLLVLACGLNAELLRSLGLKRAWVQKHQSDAVGFTLSSQDGRPFAFDALTYAVRSSASGIDYVSFFPIEETMRANLFAFPAEDRSWLPRFLREPNQELALSLPKLRRVAAGYQVAGRVESSRIDLYCTEGNPQPGIVPIGDAFQNVCPSTGIGLSKIFTDVTVLSEYVPHWFDTPGMDREKMGKFFTDLRKMTVDKKALQTATYRRNACLAQSFKWKTHRARLRISMLLGRP